jgi:xanthine dehydrogenase accessory factor
VSVTPHTYVVIVTRGHVHDAVVLQQVISSHAAYVGMIGSRQKVRTVFEDLLAQGASEERLARVHAPIGLRTGGQTPAEIAVSIMDEIVLVQHGGTGEPLSWRDNPLRTVGQV